MARALVRAGHKVTMVCGSYQGGVTGLHGPFAKGRREGIVEGIRVIELELAYSNYHGFVKRTMVFVKFALRSILIALREEYDLVIASSTPLTASIPGLFARWFRGKWFVFEVRDLWPELPRAMGVIKNPIILGLMSALEWISYRTAHTCIGLSPGIVEGIKKRVQRAKPVALIPNGCDLEFFSRVTPLEKRPQGVGESDLMAVFTGAHGIANGLDAVLDAAVLLKQRARRDIKLVFIGDGKLKPQLRSRAARQRLDNCIFLDSMPKGELISLLKGADIGLMILANVPAFYYGTSPNKFFDYLAAGLPVLNNYPGWLADLIRECKCGYVVEPDKPEMFAQALEDAADHPERLDQMREKALMLGRSRFDRRELASQFVAWLEHTAKPTKVSEGQQKE